MRTMRVYCEVTVVADAAETVLDRTAAELRGADIDGDTEEDTLDEAVAELRRDLGRALASLIEPGRLIDGIAGVEFRGGWCRAEPG
ncbi:hypothetical protein [Actinoplanes campanulatus]|uniref:hypothetical protein n=1 Tax=Actinoplanes campanulatus TaxID=113559 RepID=UPI001952A2D2|nr:hypothetical protein [Actinoplanes capillaceus]